MHLPYFFLVKHQDHQNYQTSNFHLLLSGSFYPAKMTDVSPWNDKAKTSASRPCVRSASIRQNPPAKRHPERGGDNAKPKTACSKKQKNNNKT